MESVCIFLISGVFIMGSGSFIKRKPENHVIFRTFGCIIVSTPAIIKRDGYDSFTTDIVLVFFVFFFFLVRSSQKTYVEIR